MGTASLVLIVSKQRYAPSHRSGDPSAFFSLAQTVCAPLRLILAIALPVLPLPA